jgi:hypothetical protein
MYAARDFKKSNQASDDYSRLGLLKYDDGAGLLRYAQETTALSESDLLYALGQSRAADASARYKSLDTPPAKPIPNVPPSRNNSAHSDALAAAADVMDMRHVAHARQLQDAHIHNTNNTPAKRPPKAPKQGEYSHTAFRPQVSFGNQDDPRTESLERVAVGEQQPTTWSRGGKIEPSSKQVSKELSAPFSGNEHGTAETSGSYDERQTEHFTERDLQLLAILGNMSNQPTLSDGVLEALNAFCSKDGTSIHPSMASSKDKGTHLQGNVSGSHEGRARDSPSDPASTQQSRSAVPHDKEPLQQDTTTMLPLAHADPTMVEWTPSPVVKWATGSASHANNNNRTVSEPRLKLLPAVPGTKSVPPANAEHTHLLHINAHVPTPNQLPFDRELLTKGSPAAPHLPTFTPNTDAKVAPAGDVGTNFLRSAPPAPEDEPSASDSHKYPKPMHISR